MPLVFGGIVPHPPIAIPSIGQTNLRYVRKTKKALEKLSAEFYHAQPETVIIISPHANILADAFIINHSPILKGDFEKFGDLTTKLEFINDIGFAYQIKETLETTLPIVLTTDEKLDYGTTIPLFYLAKNLKQLKVIPMGNSLLDRKTHFAFGEQLKHIIINSSKRIAVIASADLSHCLTRKAPAQYSPLGKVFDQEMNNLLKNKKHQEIMDLDENLIKESSECGYRSILILLGIFNQINYEMDILSYEGSLGVGHLVANLVLK
jgi:MEMO1 family protein